MGVGGVVCLWPNGGVGWWSAILLTMSQSRSAHRALKYSICSKPYHIFFEKNSLLKLGSRKFVPTFGVGGRQNSSVFV